MCMNVIEGKYLIQSRQIRKDQARVSLDLSFEEREASGQVKNM